MQINLMFVARTRTTPRALYLFVSERILWFLFFFTLCCGAHAHNIFFFLFSVSSHRVVLQTRFTSRTAFIKTFTVFFLFLNNYDSCNARRNWLQMKAKDLWQRNTRLLNFQRSKVFQTKRGWMNGMHIYLARDVKQGTVFLTHNKNFDKQS